MIYECVEDINRIKNVPQKKNARNELHETYFQRFLEFLNLNSNRSALELLNFLGVNLQSHEDLRKFLVNLNLSNKEISQRIDNDIIRQRLDEKECYNSLQKQFLHDFIKEFPSIPCEIWIYFRNTLIEKSEIEKLVNRGEVLQLEILKELRFKILLMIDPSTRHSPGVHVSGYGEGEYRFKGEDLPSLVENNCKTIPKLIQVGKSAEFTSWAFVTWAYLNGIHIQYLDEKDNREPIRVLKNIFIEDCISYKRPWLIDLSVIPFKDLSIESIDSEIQDWHSDYNKRQI